MDMTGTPKQIEWANKIKAGMLDQLTVTVQDMGYKRAHAGRPNNADAVLAILWPLLETQMDAAWWIDHRYDAAPKLALTLATDTDKAAIQVLN